MSVAPKASQHLPVHQLPSFPCCSVASVCAKSLTEMNPMVSVAARAGPVAPSRDIVHDYDLVLIVGRPFGSLVLWDTLCRDNGVAFFAAVSRGMQAFFFTDLGQHTFQPPVSNPFLQAPSEQLIP